MMAVRTWPDGFLWGTAASSTQCEGAAPASNWIDWERAGHAPPSGEGNGFATLYADDFRLYAGLGLRHHRLSIEWARVEPEEGRRDPAAVEHYRRVLVAARDAGVEPWVCLHHFTLPRWFADRGGFGSADNRGGAWARHVEFVAETYGDLVAGWKPVNEPVAHAAGGWLGLGLPPGRNDPIEFATQLEGVHLANFEAALRLRQTGAPTASIHNLSTVHPVGDGAAPAAAIVDAILWGSWLGATRDGLLHVPTRTPIERGDLAEAFDLVGFSYYSATGVRADLSLVPFPADAPVSPLGYAIWPEGLRGVLDRLHAELPGRPLLISEFGIGTDNDTGEDDERVRYLARGLELVGDADDGIDIRGLFHWTGVDNYEWLHGYDVAFGLIDRERVPRQSADVLRRLIAVRPGGP